MRKRRWLAITAPTVFVAAFVALRAAGDVPTRLNHCPLDGEAAGEPWVPWHSTTAVRLDLSLSAPCLTSSDCSEYAVETGCCESSTFAVTNSRFTDLANALDSCRAAAASCERMCPRQGTQASCVLGVCVVRSYTPEPQRQLKRIKLP